MTTREEIDFLDEAELLDGIVSEAKRLAVDLCKTGELSHLPHSVFMGEGARYMIVAAALVQGVLFRAQAAYLDTEAANVDARVQKRVSEAVAVAGDRAFNGGFSAVWIASERGVRGPDAMSRLMDEAAGSPERLSMLSIRSCADWMLRTTAAGFIPGEVRGDLDRYGRIITAFMTFADNAAVRLRYDRLRPAETVDALVDLPAPRSPCDAFISYRRIDGDVCARLLNQEFERRGIRCFLDVERMGNGAYNPQILSSLAHAPNFVFVMTEMALRGLDDPEDPVRIELEAAWKYARRITVVAAPRVPRDLSSLRLPPELSYLKEQNVYRLDVGEFFDASIEKIIDRGLGLKDLARRRPSV